MLFPLLANVLAPLVFVSNFARRQTWWLWCRSSIPPFIIFNFIFCRYIVHVSVSLLCSLDSPRIMWSDRHCLDRKANDIKSQSMFNATERGKNERRLRKDCAFSKEPLRQQMWSNVGYHRGNNKMNDCIASDSWNQLISSSPCLVFGRCQRIQMHSQNTTYFVVIVIYNNNNRNNNNEHYHKMVCDNGGWLTCIYCLGHVMPDAHASN